MKQYILFVLLISYLVYPVDAIASLTTQCTNNLANPSTTHYNVALNYTDTYTTTGEIAQNQTSEYNFTFVSVDFLGYGGTISDFYIGITGNEFPYPNPYNYLFHNYGTPSNSSGDQLYYEGVLNNSLGCPTFDFIPDYVAVNNNPMYLRFDLYVFHYLSNATIPIPIVLPTPNPTPTAPSPTPTPTPNTTYISSTNTSITFPTPIQIPNSIVFDKNESSNLSSSGGNTLDNVTEHFGKTGVNAVRNITNSTNNISSQISSYNYTTSKTVFNFFLPAIFNMLPAKLWLIIILGWLLEVSLIIIKR